MTNPGDPSSSSVSLSRTLSDAHGDTCYPVLDRPFPKPGVSSAGTFLSPFFSQVEVVSELLQDRPRTLLRPCT